ncbi:FCN [Mytilus coruscus]|uniref:FCN n=1 Tax=Mytilus coruscus TaxID=42192 RepID=A0A6J8BC56_MYTCO|nr:FCN [Mytilus coruscus]
MISLLVYFKYVGLECFIVFCNFQGKQLTAYCDLQNDGGGWIVVQRRIDGKQSFNQNWNRYKSGFGNPLHEFWIGNENLHVLTDRKDVILHIQMMTWEGKNYTAVYSGFHVGSEQEKYKLNIQQIISGDAGDSFKYPSSYMLRHNNMAFSTPDRDNDVSFQNCAQLLQSGWWFNMCYSSNLNGVYLKGPYGHRYYGESFGQPTTEGTGIEWYPLKQKQYSLKYVEMKIRAK